jgi:triacylglycerol lipase
MGEQMSATPDFTVSDEAAPAIIAREALATVATLALLPFGLLANPARTPRRREQRTVVLVHGYLANSASLLPARAYLKAHGFKQILAYDYQARHGLLPAARGLKEFLRRHVRGGRVDLVCHSFGGLVARAYLQLLGGARRVDQCITLGTPHRGTYNAYWLASRVGRELRPDSATLAGLAATRGNARNVRHLSIVAGSDNIVIPRVFGNDREEVLHLPGVGHLGLLYSPRALQAITSRLLGGVP